MTIDRLGHASSGGVSAVTAADVAEIPDHAVALPGGGWRLWRDFVLRGTGFPVSLVRSLSSEASARVADRLHEATQERKRCRDAALEAVRRAFEVTDPAAFAMLSRKRRRIFKGTIAVGEGNDADDALARAVAEERALREEYAEVYAREAAAAAARISAIAGHPRFREAALWQNHQAARRAAHGLMSTGHTRRRAAHLLAMQVQRYAVKNDSIGFFGPVGWGRLSDRAMTADVTPGPSLIAGREVYFEGWCIEALIDRLNEDPSVRAWTAPRLMAGVWIHGSDVYAPEIGRVPLTAEERRVLHLCDGMRTAADIATALADSPEPGGVSPADVVDTLEALLRRQLIVWRLEVASELHPDRALAARIERIGDPAIRATCGGALRQLVAARDRVAHAGGDADALEASLDELDDTFRRLTGREPSRRAGATYAARGLVYEDCRRDCDVVLGQAVLDRLGPPLSLVLDGVRWAAAEVGSTTREHFRRVHAELREAHGASEIDGHVFFNHVRRATAASAPRLLRDLQQKVQATWQSVLDVDAGGAAARVTRSVDDLAPRAREALRPRADVWSRAHYISPDLMIAAPGLDALRRGEFHCVLGEVHATNSLMWSSFAAQHPRRQDLDEAVGRDVADRVMVSAQLPKELWLARLALSVYPPAAWQYQFGDDLPNRTSCRAAPAAMFTAIDDGETAVLRARDGSLEFDAMELFGQLLCTLTDEVVGRYLPPSAHAPRITIDDLAIARERWCLRPSEMPFLAERDPAAQFAAVRAWARARRMPPRVFYKSPRERKPCYVDFDSPVYAELLSGSCGASTRHRSCAWKKCCPMSQRRGCSTSTGHDTRPSSGWRRACRRQRHECQPPLPLRHVEGSTRSKAGPPAARSARLCHGTRRL